MGHLTFLSLLALQASQITLTDAAVVTPQLPPQLAQIGAYNGSAYSPPVYPSPWMDPGAPGWEVAYTMARDFVSQLSLLEKVNITTGVGWESERCVGNTGGVPRLGMRGLCLQDGPLGVRMSDYNSAFPAGLAAGATWSRRIIYERGLAIGREFRDKGIDIMLGPSLGPLGRSPLGGRNWEGFAVDPYLLGQEAAKAVEGIQKAGVIACAKHYIANEQEHFRQVSDAALTGYEIDEAISANVDDKTMHEVYNWPFVDTVHAGVGSFMCSYNQVNNSYGCQNSKLLNGILKGEMGYQGFVMSDWAAHHSGASAAAAGLDMSMPGDIVFNSGDSYWGANLTLSVLNGTVAEHRLDDMVMRIMAAFFKVGRTVQGEPDINFASFVDDRYGYLHPAAEAGWGEVNKRVDVTRGHAGHIRESAAKGTVLLKNTNGSLPLCRPKFVAVIGGDAGPNSLGPNGCPDRGCSDGTFAMGWGSGTAEFPYLVTPDTALQNQAVADGTRYESVLSNYEWTSTEALVTDQDAIPIVFVHAQSGEGYLDVDGNIGDRKNFTLWADGDELVRNVSSLNPNTVVVMHTPGAVDVTGWYENPNITAILWSGPPGQESGNSITDILYGKTSPGRLPFTWGPSEESYGTEIITKPNRGRAAPQDDFSEGVFIDYRHFDRVAPNKGDVGAPIYEFGYGLSWTTFEYANLQVTPRNARAYEPTTGETMAAPSFGGYSRDLSDYLFPEGFNPLKLFIYPYLSSTDAAEASNSTDYGREASEFLPEGALDGSPQPLAPASGPNGGNPQLWDVLVTVEATITNNGKAVGDAVPQLYVSLGGEGEPVRVLRGFERIEGIAPGQSVKFTADLTRRDLSNWDVAKQDWVVTDAPKKVFVGSSSRDLPLQGDLWL
ncbi:beta-glucosidase [Geosmithia morbida]|uniref:beta-glucosidase n=1 Tax=Geosmithia morbida TaxID=1094350 RepID=A0A9P4YPE9_9HYPO|nr:beta-glucosidase [Geosmithia morbida]KAF4119308.1 beta-glucosidase [Geosmithia morbida]